MDSNRAIMPPTGEVIITRNRGVMHLEPASPIANPPQVGPATELQKAEVERIRELRRKDGEAHALSLRRKARAANRMSA